MVLQLGSGVYYEREPLVGSLIYGDHKVPKKSRPWKERWKIPASGGYGLCCRFSFLRTSFYNYREEGAVKQFLGDVFGGHPDAAFAKWDVDGASYSMQDFLTDWGKDGYYTQGCGIGQSRRFEQQGNIRGRICRDRDA
jgi:hypothetical protein